MRSSFLDFSRSHGIIHPMMTYELMVLVNTATDLTDSRSQKEIIEKLVGDKAVIKDVTSMGKRQLAYPIVKQTEATYLLAILEGTVKTAELDSKAKLMDDVLRLMLTVKE